MKKAIVLLTVLLTIMMTLSVSASYPIENIIENGTFDTNMDNWNLLPSTNMSIQSTGGVCAFNTTHTDYLFIGNYTDFNNGTFYNTTAGQGINENGVDPSFDGRVELANTTVQLLPNPYFNSSQGNWSYSEYQNTEDYIEGFYSLPSKSAPSSYGIQSRKLQNITEYDIDFSSDPNAFFQGTGSTDFVYNSTGSKVDGHWITSTPTHNRFSRMVWNITERNQSNDFATNFTVQRNATGSHDALSGLVFGFMNTGNDTQASNSVIFVLSVGASELSMTVAGRIYADNGTLVTSTGISSLAKEDLNEGVDVLLQYNSTAVVLKAWNTTTSAEIVNHGIAIIPWMNFTVNCIGIGNQNMTTTGTARIYDGYINNIESWYGTVSLDTSSRAKIVSNFEIANNSAIHTEVYRRHYHDPQNGLIRSSYEVFNESWSNSVYNTTTTGTSAWIKEEADFNVESGNITAQLYTAHSITEGSTSYPAKMTNWDNCFVNATDYRVNGTYTSDIYDRGYYADWMLGFVEYKKDGTNFTFETRTGNVPTPDGSWSSWQQMTGTSITTNGEPYDEILGTIQSANGQYIQFKLEIATNQTWETTSIYMVILESVPIATSSEWGVIDQDFTKPYTNESTLKYDYKIDYLNNTNTGNVTIMIDSYQVAQHNFTYFTTNWISEEHVLPTTFNSSGTYNLNITTYITFNSTNGTASILVDNVELNIPKQSPTITEFNIQNGTTVIFNGTIQDLTRNDTDNSFVGTDGIDSVNITIGGVVLEVTNISDSGNGSMEFYHEWTNPPVMMSNTTVANATILVVDDTGFQDSEVESVQYPKLLDYLFALVSFGLFALIILVIIIKHLMIDEANDFMPEVIIGKPKKR